MKIYPKPYKRFMASEGKSKFPTLVQIGKSFYELRLKIEVVNVSELRTVLDKHDVRLLQPKGPKE